MNDEQARQLLRELKWTRISTVVIAIVLVLAALNRMFRFFPG
jgi:hypothetical protein